MAFPTGWGWKVALTIDHNKVDALLSNFTLIFTQSMLPAQLFDADGVGPALNGGGDIRFSSDAAGTNRLACDVRIFTTDNDPANGVADIAVIVPEISAIVDTVIYMWWGKTAESQPVETDTFGQYNAYDGNYVAVWDKSDGPSQEISNRTSSLHNGTKVATGNPLEVSGAVGKAQRYNGTNSRVNVPNHTSLSGFNNFTVLSVFRVNNFPSGSNLPSLVNAYDAGGNQRSWGLFFRASSGPLALQLSNNGSTFTTSPSITYATIGTNTWRAVHARRSGSTAEIWMDGSSRDSLTYSGTLHATTSQLRMGTYLDGSGNKFDGDIDETRISNVARSPAWIKSESENLLNQSTFAVAGTPENLSAAEAPSGSGEVGALAVLLGTGSAHSTASGEVQAVGSVTGVGETLTSGSGGLEAVGSLAGVGETPIPSGNAEVRAVGSIAGAASLSAVGVGEVRAVGSLTGAGETLTSGFGEVRSVGSITGVGSILASGSGGLQAVGSLTGVGETLTSGSGEVRAAGSLAGVGETTQVGWLRYIDFTIPSSVFNTELTNYPALITQKASGFPSEIFDHAKADGSDLRAYIGETQIALHIASWDPVAKTCQLWVKIPTASFTVDTTVRFRFDNLNAPVVLPADPFGQYEVWDSFAAVYGLETKEDWTENANNGSGNTVAVAGQVGGGQDTLSATEHITVPVSPSLKSLQSTGMVSAWVKSDIAFPSGSTSTQYRGILAREEGGSLEGTSWWFDWTGTNSTRSLRGVVSNGSAFGIIQETWAPVVGQYHHVAFGWYAGVLRLIVDGILLHQSSPAVTSAQVTEAPLRIGRLISDISARRWQGAIDHACITTVPRATAWLTADFRLQGEQSVVLSGPIVRFDPEGFGEIQAAGSLTGAGSALASGFGELQAEGSLSGAGTASASGSGEVRTEGSLIGTGSTSVSGFGEVRAEGSIEGISSQVPTGVGEIQAAGSLEGAGEITAFAFGEVLAEGSLAGAGSISVSGFGEVRAIGSIAGASSIIVSGFGEVRAVGTLSGVGSTLMPTACGPAIEIEWWDRSVEISWDEDRSVEISCGA